jgi:transposase
MHGISRGKKHFKLSKEECLDVLDLKKKGYSVRNIARHFKVDVSTIYSILKRYHVDYLTV